MSVLNQNKTIQVVIQNYCSNCGTKISQDSKFCLNCGMLLSNDDNKVKEYVKRRNVTNIEKLKYVLGTTAVIWLSVLLASVFSPDLISGSKQEHLPLVMWTAWLWGLLANMFLIRLYREQNDLNLFKLQVLSVIILWSVVAIVSIFTPPFVTGSDPTSLPLVSLVAPFIGCILTAGVWFLGKPANEY